MAQKLTPKTAFLILWLDAIYTARHHRATAFLFHKLYDRCVGLYDPKSGLLRNCQEVLHRFAPTWTYDRDTLFPSTRTAQTFFLREYHKLWPRPAKYPRSLWKRLSLSRG